MSSARREVAFLDLAATYRELRPQLAEAWERVMSSGWYLLAGELIAFENEFAAYVGARHCVGVASGLDALTLALRALGIGPGDEVVVPSNTYIATWLAVSAVGATPVAVEPDPSTHTIDPLRIPLALTDRTRAILPVHLYGRPAEMDVIIGIARRHGCFIVEDAAQAHGARFRDERIGTHGDAVCWSFHPSKNLGAFGDGGAITTGSADLAERVKTLRNYGSREKYVNDERGVNSRLDELQAAFLRVKLGHLDEWNKRRSDVAARYLQEFAGIDRITVPLASAHVAPAWHQFVVRSPERDHLRLRLAKEGIETLIHYPIPPHRQRAYESDGPTPPLPIADQLASEVLSLPIGPHLVGREVEQVIEAMVRVGS